MNKNLVNKVKNSKKSSKKPLTATDFTQKSEKSNSSAKHKLPAEALNLLKNLAKVSYLDSKILSHKIRNFNWFKFEQKNQASQQQYFELVLAVNTAIEKLNQRNLAQNSVKFNQDLPICHKIDEIKQAIKHNQVLILAGETGSGKTTQLPKICLSLGLGTKGMIGHTQPRRIAARSVAARIASELEGNLGDLVGYQVRFNDNLSDKTQIKLMTDGILLAQISRDPLLLEYDCLIIDEAHERSLNNDFILGYLKGLLLKRPELKLIITSATIDLERFSAHFDNAPIISVSGRTYPVEIIYQPPQEEQDQTQAIVDAVMDLREISRDDILIFLSGEREIRDAAEALSKQISAKDLANTVILPLYARLSNSEQNKIFNPDGQSRIILATNVAETSLTVPRIKYVIDTGFARISRYSPASKIQRLHIEAISKASANQRAGRCGRVSSGVCIRLYSEEDFNNRPDFTDPEILRTNLASVILQMINIGLTNIEKFPFLDSPDSRQIKDGFKILQELEFICEKTKKLTAVGKKAASLPVDPRLAKMLLTSLDLGCSHEISVIVSGLSVQDVKIVPGDKKESANQKHLRFRHKKSDFLGLLNLWDFIKTQQKQLSNNEFRRMCQKDYLHYLRIREWQDLYGQLRLSLLQLGEIKALKQDFSQNLALNSTNELPVLSLEQQQKQQQGYSLIHKALLSGLLANIGQKQVIEVSGSAKNNPKIFKKPAIRSSYMGAYNKVFDIFPGSYVAKTRPNWLISFELVDTSKLWARTVAEVEPQWILEFAPHLVKSSYSNPHWSKNNGCVMAYEKISLFGLTVVAKKAVVYTQIDPLVCYEIFIRSALVEGDFNTKHSFFKYNQQLIGNVLEVEDKLRRKDILVSDDVLFDFYTKRIPQHINNQKSFDYWWKNTQKDQADLLNFTLDDITNSSQSTHNFPDFWQQGNFKLKLNYNFKPGDICDGIVLNIPLGLLNQIENKGFEWLIEPLQPELIVALIKNLPKNIRKNFVPAPNYAKAFLDRVTDNKKLAQMPLSEALSYEFRRMSGVTLSPEIWDFKNLPAHLKMTFMILGDNFKQVATGDDLTLLKQQLQPKIEQNLAKVAKSSSYDVERENLTEWNFSLNKVYRKKQLGIEVKAYPALVDQGQSVAIKLFANEEEQILNMKQGLRKLVRLNLPSPLKYLEQNMPNKAKLGLYFNPFGDIKSLIEDCVNCALDDLITKFGFNRWQQQEFNELIEFIKPKLNEKSIEISLKIERILTLHYDINKRIKGKIDLKIINSMADIKQNLSELVFKGFVSYHGIEHIDDILRYLNAVEKRLDKLYIDSTRDLTLLRKLENSIEIFSQHKNYAKYKKEVFYMVQEFRISLFAQIIKTAYPISHNRIMQFLEAN